MVEAIKQPKTSAPAGPADLRAPSLYINREISLLEFYRRVLAQAADHRHPLLERVKFLAIVSDLIHELFMVRVSDLQAEVSSGPVTLSPDGMSPNRQLKAISDRVAGI